MAIIHIATTTHIDIYIFNKQKHKQINIQRITLSATTVLYNRTAWFDTTSIYREETHRIIGSGITLEFGLLLLVRARVGW